MEELIFLGPSLDAASVARCREEWLKLPLHESHSIQVDVDKLTKIDTAGLQLLLALKKDTAARGKKFSFRGASEALQNQAEILGLSSFLFGENVEEAPDARKRVP